MIVCGLQGAISPTRPNPGAFRSDATPVRRSSLPLPWFWNSFRLSSSLSDWGLRLFGEDDFGALRADGYRGIGVGRGFGAGYGRWRAAICRAPARYGLIR